MSKLIDDLDEDEINALLAEQELVNKQFENIEDDNEAFTDEFQGF